MSQTIYQVDAFAARPFTGNPAAVCVLAKPAPEAWMQSVAAEMNLSETAFLHPEGEGYRLRWFTPTVEVSLCGHATLASAHILWETGALPIDEIARFQTLSGELTARRVGEAIELNFPAGDVSPASAPDELLSALGVSANFVGKSSVDYLVEIASEQKLRELQPDFAQLAKLRVRGVIVTARSDQPEYDFLSRFFAPASGINEDPVTGSAHCTLGKYWQMKLGRSEFTAYQASTRGGVIKVRMEGDRAYLSGRAITVLRGELL